MEEKRICAFIDALGTSGIFLGAKNEKKKNMLKLISRISKRNASQSFNQQQMQFALIERPSPQITTFSDNIVLSCTFGAIESVMKVGNDVMTVEEDSATFFRAMIAQIVSITWDALRYGILFRGGICLGDLVHNDEIIAGEALVKAVKLEAETKEARIEVQKEIMTLRDSKGKLLIDDTMKECCFEKVDGRWFVKVFGYHQGIFYEHNYFMEQDGLNTHKDRRDVLMYYSECIASEYSNVLKQNDKTVVAKWNWFIDDLERSFKTTEGWISLEDSFEAMFGAIIKETEWTEKM